MSSIGIQLQLHNSLYNLSGYKLQTVYKGNKDRSLTQTNMAVKQLRLGEKL